MRRSILLLALCAAAPALAQAPQPLGIPECDDVLARMRACFMVRAPEARRDEVDPTINELREMLRRDMANPAERAALPATCTRTRAQLAQENAGIPGCDF